MNFENIHKDVYASLGQFFQTFFDGGLPVYFENHGNRPEANFIEARIDGPNIEEIANKQYVLEVEIDFLIVAEQCSDVFLVRRTMGKCSEALNADIPIVLDGLSVGCLSTSGPFGKVSKIVANYYGLTDKDKKVLQASVSTTLSLLF